MPTLLFLIQKAVYTFQGDLAELILIFLNLLKHRSHIRSRYTGVGGSELALRNMWVNGDLYGFVLQGG